MFAQWLMSSSHQSCMVGVMRTTALQMGKLRLGYVSVPITQKARMGAQEPWMGMEREGKRKRTTEPPPPGYSSHARHPPNPPPPPRRLQCPMNAIFCSSPSCPLPHMDPDPGGGWGDW